MKKAVMLFMVVVMLFTATAAMAACHVICFNNSNHTLRFQVDNNNVSTFIEPGDTASGYVSNDYHTLYAYYANGRLAVSRAVNLIDYREFTWTINP